MHPLLADLKNQAIANRKAGAWLSSASAETAQGCIVCFVDFSHGNARSLGAHVSARFDLNRKRIAAEKLSALLSGQPT